MFVKRLSTRNERFPSELFAMYQSIVFLALEGELLRFEPMRKGPSGLLSRIFALCIGLAGVLGATQLPPPDLLKPYAATACGQPGQIRCNITPTGRKPTAADLQGLSSTLFYNYFGGASNTLVCDGFSWTPTAANANGYVIGHVGPVLKQEGTSTNV